MPKPAVTDAEGRFTLNGPGRERLALIRVEGPTIATEDLRVLTRAGASLEATKGEHPNPGARCAYYGAAFEHATAPTQVVTGVVRDKDTKKPLKGVEVRYIWTAPPTPGIPPAGELPVRAVSDDEGRYRLVGLPKTAGCRLIALPSDDTPYLVCQKEVMDNPGLEAMALDFELKRGIWVRGRVTDKATGKPVLATVAYFASPDNSNVEGVGLGGTGYVAKRETEENGLFRVVALAGPGLLVVRVNGPYLAASESGDKAYEGGYFGIDAVPRSVVSWQENAIVRLNPEPGAESVPCDATVDPGKSLRVRLVGPDGKPVKGVQVYGQGGWREWWSQSLGGDEGVVRTFNPRLPRMVFFKQEKEGLAGKLQVKETEDGPVTLKLARAAIVTGRIVDVKDSPVAGVYVGLTYLEEVLLKASGVNSDWHYHEMTTDKDGRFRAEGLVPGLKYKLWNPSQGIQRDFTVKAGEKDLGDVKVKLALTPGGD